MQPLKVNSTRYPQVMEIADLFIARREVLKALAAEFKGTKKRFAELGGVSPSYLTRLLSDEGSDGGKSIGDEVALRFESSLDLEPGELLFPRALRPDDDAPPAPSLSPRAESIAARLDDLTDSRQARAFALVDSTLRIIEEEEEAEHSSSSTKRRSRSA